MTPRPTVHRSIRPTDPAGGQAPPQWIWLQLLDGLHVPSTVTGMTTPINTDHVRIRVVRLDDDQPVSLADALTAVRDGADPDDYHVSLECVR